MQEFFLIGKWCRHNFFRVVYAFFLAIHVACFFLLQRLCRNFFLKSFTPPLKDQMVDVLEEPIKHLKRVGQPQCYGKGHTAKLLWMHKICYAVSIFIDLY